MNRSEILDTAYSCVCKDRNAQYGEPEDSFEVIAELWEIYLTHRHAAETTINPEDVGVMMALMKIARIATGRAKTDSYIDACGYIACASEIATDGTLTRWIRQWRRSVREARDGNET